ncbi:hypothetical protein HA50_29480 [Pantoea cypripedii]|uniref:Uncharacterized protein n=1 Tax=Pantoea cypripedii TaxID=55209 RepID=A0A1X1EGI2_PANCY|nr:hypothetical protein HA50_29480 [Pantoea cypripedii]
MMVITKNNGESYFSTSPAIGQASLLSHTLIAAIINDDNADDRQYAILATRILLSLRNNDVC